MRSFLNGLEIASAAFSLMLCACRETSIGPAPTLTAGDRFLIVNVSAYDEYRQPLPLSGPVAVTLISSDRTWQKTIPQGNSSCTFVGLPSQAYVVGAEMQGFYPYETTAGDQSSGSNWTAWLNLYRLPPPSMRVDSIRCSQNSYSKTVIIQLFSKFDASLYSSRSAVIFVGKTASVGPKPGTYIQTFLAYQSGGTNESDITVGAQQLGVPPGGRVFVTARFMTPVTKSFVDASSSLQVWTYLEENTNVVTTFVLQ